MRNKVRHIPAEEGEAVAKPRVFIGNSAAPREVIERRILARVDRALRREIEKHGPMLLWLGGGEFPRNHCTFRGLSVGKGRGGIIEFLGVKPTKGRRRWPHDLRVREMPATRSLDDTDLIHTMRRYYPPEVTP